MSQPNARWWIKDKDQNEGIITRYIITGKLVLETPAHFGNGDVSELTDMPIIRDSLDGRALLTGSSIAGALRSYLREYDKGYGQTEKRDFRSAYLFGHNIPEEREHERDKHVGYASLLTIDDVFSENPTTELRDGVRIDPKTRTAVDGALYNFELLTAGTIFDLRFELAIPKGHDGGRFEKNGNYQTELLQSLAIALRGLENGKIRLGKRKRRGFGQCKVEEWQVRKYDMTKPDGLLAWLKRPTEGIDETDLKNKSIVELLELANLPLDKRSIFSLEACFSLDKSSLLIRADGDDVNAPDMVHLCSNGKPIVSGTSLAGVIRARALRIANTLELPTIDVPGEKKDEPDKAPHILIDMFGGQFIDKDNNGKEKIKMKASRVIVNETEIAKSINDLVLNRIKIDRFTGSSYPGALFNQQPVWGQPETEIKLDLTLINPQPAEVGLLLHVLKDLWTGDLPIGGESSVGRGRLQGKEAILTCQNGKPKSEEWVIKQNGNGLKIEGDKQRLEKLAEALLEVRHAKTKEAA
jgi:CRISPR/Cas system CSM-associated protein Csm3 (group 7 of RAMP superfamily)